jgi:hypothetical protein
MLTELQLKNWLGIILQISILFSIVLVLAGGSALLWAQGGESLVISTAKGNIDIRSLWDVQHLFSPLGLIELGLLVLVAAQVLRVAMLCGYYTYIRDYWFMLFSFFILSVILYSLIWQ